MLATSNFFPKTKLIPTQKISIDPVMERYSRAFVVKIGSMNTARSVILPWKSPTGIAEKAHPIPNDAVSMKIMTKSKMDLAARIDTSLWIPSCTAPTTAKAPIHTVNEETTKAVTKLLSLFPELCFSGILQIFQFFLPDQYRPEKRPDGIAQNHN